MSQGNKKPLHNLIDHRRGFSSVYRYFNRSQQQPSNETSGATTPKTNAN